MSNYEKYQLQWMISHGYSIQDLIKELQELQYEDPENGDMNATPISELFDVWVTDIGFGSEIWACEAEWSECEGSEQTKKENKNSGCWWCKEFGKVPLRGFTTHGCTSSLANYCPICGKSLSESGV